MTPATDRKLSWAKAAESYGLEDLLMAWDDDEEVGILSPDAMLDGLDLFEGSWVAEGDLTISGNLNSDDESGFLVVLGNLTVGSIGSGGGQIVVRGNVTAAHAVAADYNHGYLHVMGDLAARVIAAEHTVKVGGRVRGLTIDFGGFDVAGDFTPDVPRDQAVYKAKETFVPEALNSGGYVDGPALMERLLDGEPILLDGRA